jgi:hypothetical protein
LKIRAPGFVGQSASSASKRSKTPLVQIKLAQQQDFSGPLAYFVLTIIFEAVMVEVPKIFEGFQPRRCNISGAQRRVLNLNKQKTKN